jgi:hypothetical protein
MIKDNTWVKVDEKLVWILVRVRIHESFQGERDRVVNSKPGLQILPS